MGTSKDYDAPTTPQWKELKGKVTRIVKKSSLNNDEAKELIKLFIEANGGSKSIVNDNEMGAENVKNIARNIGGFLAGINESGFKETIKKLGFDYLEGKSVTDITIHLIDFFSDESSTINEIDARNALSQLMEDLLNEAKNIDEISNILNEYTDSNNLFLLLSKFFGYYIYQQFCRSFYERLISKVGDNRAGMFLDSILDFVKSEIKLLSTTEDIISLDWNGNEGEEICNKILEKTLNVFGG